MNQKKGAKSFKKQEDSTKTSQFPDSNLNFQFEKKKLQVTFATQK